MSEKNFAVHRQATHLYFIHERFEAGMVLQGTEVKSVRAGKINLKDSYARIRHGEVWLINCHISPYPFGNRWNHDPLRDRKLLLHSQEIRKLLGKTEIRGLTLVPLRVYGKQGKIKCEIALAQGKKLYDKREAIKRREQDRESRAALHRKHE